MSTEGAGTFDQEARYSKVSRSVNVYPSFPCGFIKYVHQPILATYALIRSKANLILVVGSGFGTAEDVYPYLTGPWSQDWFRVVVMPFNGVLFASRMMVAKEAATSESVKELSPDCWHAR